MAINEFHELDIHLHSIFALLYGGLINTADEQARRKRPTHPKERYPRTQHIVPRGLRLSFSETLTHVAPEAAGRQVRHRIGSISRDAEIARRKEVSRKQSSTWTTLKE